MQDQEILKTLQERIKKWRKFKVWDFVKISKISFIFSYTKIMLQNKFL